MPFGPGPGGGSGSTTLTVNTTPVVGGAAGQIHFDSAGAKFTENAALSFDVASGTLQLSTQGSGAGVLIGGDARLYRDSANVLRTPGSLTVDTAITGARLIPTGSTVPQNGLYLPAANVLGFSSNTGQRMVMLSAGHTLIQASGTTAISSPNGYTPFFQINAAGASNSAQSINTFLASATGPQLFGGKSRGASIGSFTIVQTGDALFQINGSGADGSVFRNSTLISSEVDAVPGAGAVPGRIVFSTSTGAGSMVESFRIDSNQIVNFQINRGLTFNNQISSAGANTGTLLNAPTAGDPGFWLKINIGGVNYAIPCWAG